MHGRARIMSLHATAAVPQAVAHKGASASLVSELVRVAACIVAVDGLDRCVSGSADRRKSATGLGRGDASHALITSVHVVTDDPRAVAHMGALYSLDSELVRVEARVAAVEGVCATNSAWADRPTDRRDISNECCIPMFISYH